MHRQYIGGGQRPTQVRAIGQRYAKRAHRAAGNTLGVERGGQPLYGGCFSIGSGNRNHGQRRRRATVPFVRSEEHTSELQSLMRISYAVFCLKKKKRQHKNHTKTTTSA